MSYEYTLPTTGAFFYSSCITATDSTLLSTASQARAQLRDVLKRLKRSDHKDIASVIKTIEDYTPALASIYYELTTTEEPITERHADLVENKPMVTSWRATLHEQKIPGKSPARIDVTGIEAEVVFVLLTYAYALSNHASLPSHDPQRVVNLLCQAAGIFALLHSTITTRLARGKMCPELYPQLSASLERMTLAEAQLAAMVQLQEKASNSVLCRIAIGAADHFSGAAGTLSSHPMIKAIPNDFRQHLRQRQDYALSRAYHYFALEQEKIGQVGFALACARLAEKLHKDEQTTTSLRVLTKQNAQVTFQPVPSKDEVQSKLPSGRDFVKATPFVFMKDDRQNAAKADFYAGSGAYY